MRVYHIMGVVGLLALVGCGFAPADAEEMRALPPSYQVWFTETQACSGLRGNLSDLEFHRVEGDGFACPSGTCSGRWEPPNRIYIASKYVQHEMVVRHEMLHALLRQAGHPDPPFAGRGCGLTWESWRPHVARLSGIAPPQ